MIYIYFYIPKDSEVPEVIGSFVCDEKDYHTKMEEIKNSMPKEMKDKGYWNGSFCMSEDTVNKHWELSLLDLKIKPINNKT